MSSRKLRHTYILVHTWFVHVSWVCTGRELFCGSCVSFVFVSGAVFTGVDRYPVQDGVGRGCFGCVCARGCSLGKNGNIDDVFIPSELIPFSCSNVIDRMHDFLALLVPAVGDAIKDEDLQGPARKTPVAEGRR